MNKSNRVAAAIAVFALCATFHAQADTEIVDGVEYSYTIRGESVAIVNSNNFSKDDDGTCRTSPFLRGSDGQFLLGTFYAAIPDSTTGSLEIPSTFGGLPVASIGLCAFVNCRELTAVTIPDTVNGVESFAFYDCSGLTSTLIPDSTSVIGQGAFYGCAALASVTIPASVTSIGRSAFFGCSGLTSVTMKGDAPSVADYAFSGVASGCVVRIPRGASGYAVDVNGNWQGMTVEYYDAVPTKGLVAYYPFDGDATDASGNGNHGTMHGTRPTADRKGRLGSAILFGSGNYISVPSSPTLNSPTNEITIAAWVRVGYWYGSSLAPLLCKGNVQYRFQLSRSTERCFLFDGSSYADCPCTPIRGEWHHIGASYDGATFRTYVDGVLTGERSILKSITASNFELFIGWDPPQNKWFLGAMDELRIYDRALSDEEMSALYAADATQQTALETKGWHVTVADSETAISSLAEAQEALRTKPCYEQDYAACALGFGLKDAGWGDFPQQRCAFPGKEDSGNQYFATRVQGTIRIPSAGDWTFAVRSDDGFRLTITGAGFIAVLQSSKYYEDVLTFPLNFPKSGSYEVELIHWNMGGNAHLDFSAAKGEWAAFDSSAFTLVGDPECEIALDGGLAAWMAENGLAGAWDAKDASGIANVFRYVFDVPDGAFEETPLIDIELEDNAVVVKTPEAKNTAGVAVSVVESSDVAGASVTATVPLDATGRTEFPLGTDPSRFYRLSATRTE